MVNLLWGVHMVSSRFGHVQKRLAGLAVSVAVGGALLLGQPQLEAANDGLSNAEVNAIVAAAVAQANVESSPIRAGSTPTRMHIAVVDRDGRLRRLHSQGDAWVGSIGIAKAKAYTAAAFSSDENALTTRTIGALSQPGGALWQIGNSNHVGSGSAGITPQGIIEFPGGLPLYKNGKLVGGIGVSGDVVDADEDVAEAGACAFAAPAAIRADTVLGAPYVVAAEFTCP